MESGITKQDKKEHWLRQIDHMLDNRNFQHIRNELAILYIRIYKQEEVTDEQISLIKQYRHGSDDTDLD